MTVKTQAQIATAKFVAGTIVLGGLAALAFTHYPSVAGTAAAIALFLYTVKFYYEITRDRLQREQDDIQRALRSQR